MGKTQPEPEFVVSEMTASLLRAAADFFKAADAGDKAGRARLAHLADVCLRVAKAMVKNPNQGCRSVIGPDDLDGRFHPPTEQTWGVGEVAAWLLETAAGIMRGTQAPDQASQMALAENAAVFLTVAELARLAPGGRGETELAELLPYLRRIRRISESMTGGGSYKGLDELMQDEGFLSVARRIQKLNGRDFDALPQEVKQAFCSMLSEVWREERARAGTPLTAVEQQAVRHATAHPRMAWARPPCVAGEWRELAPEAAADFLIVASAACRFGAEKTTLALAYYCDRVRVRDMACHGEAVMAEVQGYAAGGRPGLATLYMTPRSTVAGDGGSAWIHDLNDREQPRLHSEAACTDYLRLFLNQVRNEGKRFEPVETETELLARARDPEALSRLISPHVRPIERVGTNDDGFFILRATVCYGDALFTAFFQLTPTGLIEMIDDHELMTGLPILPEDMDGPFVMIRPDA
jgi:hypothetical protein